MKVFTAFPLVLVWVGVALSGPALDRQVAPEEEEAMQYFLVDTGEGLYRVEDLVNAEVDERAAAADLTYYYYSRSRPNNPVLVTSSDVSPLRNTDFSVAKQTLLIIHGWTNTHQSPVNVEVRQAILSRHDVNVIVVDWGPVAAKNYVSAMASVGSVGIFVADFVRSLVNTYSLRLGMVACVGHSLGAHVCGNTGASLRGQIDHIVGLDPAGPLFTVGNTGNRLDPTDAHFVHVIHTNGGLLGFGSSIGHADYYPNGGRSQPGCGLDLTGSCAHSRAYTYYAEAVSSSSNAFRSLRCTSYSDFTSSRCTANAQSRMGGFSVDIGASGDYYLDTNNAALYARG